ncbi:hypothetical protein COV15_01690 [Candidatus Woesearchaeota archaeon CG10_big_fil_rev_8_21_14_0_10_34_12]|nr:MAG: hypothetical protein COV15_01690 [Candidatus Woesearchaeota archaeon CG10_big_fil_rev_8_21_14_0_10_34_12]
MNGIIVVYFQVHMQPLGEGSSDAVVVDNFHPKREEAAKKLLEGRIIGSMESYANVIGEWSGVPMTLEFSERGLNHIMLPFRSGLDLWVEEEKYRSHNIHSFQDAGAVTAVITCYLNWLSFAINDIGK